MNPTYLKLSGIAKFALTGQAYTTPSADTVTLNSLTGTPPGTVSRTYKPDIGDAAFRDLGHVEVKIKNKTEIEEIRRGTPGRKIRYAVLENARDLDFDISAKEVTNFIFGLMFGAPLPVAADGTVLSQFNPLAAKACEGFLHLDLYNHDDNSLALKGDYWVYVQPPDSVDLTGDKRIATDFLAKVEWSPLNTVAGS